MRVYPICLQHNSIAKFLEAKGFVEEALEVATDPGGQSSFPCFLVAMLCVFRE